MDYRDRLGPLSSAHMKTIKGNLKEDFSWNLFWTRIVFLPDDEAKKTKSLLVLQRNI